MAGAVGPDRLFCAAVKCAMALDEPELVRLRSCGEPRHLLSGTTAYLQLLGVVPDPPSVAYLSSNEAMQMC